MSDGSVDGRLGADEALRQARAAVRRLAEATGRPHIADDAALVVGELVTNAVLHGDGCVGVEVDATEQGLVVRVRDRNRTPPLVSRPADDSLTGRGLRLVNHLAVRWGAEPLPQGKVVWAEVTGESAAAGAQITAALEGSWEAGGGPGDEPRYHVELGDVPTDLLLAAKSHVDNLIREFTLASAGARSGLTADVPPHLAGLLGAVAGRFAEARLAIKQQALDAARRRALTTRLALHLPASAADAAEDYSRALDEIDSYCRARRLLTLETPYHHRVFRRWYIDELATQLRAAAAGQPAPLPEPFEHRLVAELEKVSKAHVAAERAARMYAVAAALANADRPEAVAHVVLDQAVAALGADGGGLLLATPEGTMAVPGTVGYTDDLVARLRSESTGAELPAATALRLGRPVWLESRQDRDRQFPDLVGWEPNTVSMCAVPLDVEGRTIGALRFSFSQARLFDEDERRFVLAVAAQTAQALARTQHEQARIDANRRLQRSLLPPALPDIPGVEVASVYRPFGDGLEVGGDFYDVWPVAPTCWAFAVGDVAGTGPEAAAVTALVRHTLRALTMGDTDPRSVLTALNRALLAAAAEDRFCTAVFGVLTTDGPSPRVRLASGGHPRPLVRRAGGRVEEVPLHGGLLGIFADAEVDVVEVELGPADALVLFTDGATEARNGIDQLGPERVSAVLAGADGDAWEVVGAVERAVLRHSGGCLSDDMALVALRVAARR